jgi:predicted transcriptional regulator
MAKKNKNIVLNLGPLEQSALEHIWKNKQASVIDVHRQIGEKAGISVNTIGSTLERLYRKNLLKREKVSHSYQYEAALTREDFLARQISETVGGMKELSQSGLLASFVDLIADTEDEETLNELEKLIAEKRGRI